MSDTRVAIARYHSPIEAGLARATLESAGIEASLGTPADVADPAALGMAVQLEVARADARQALEILQRSEEGVERKWSDPRGEPERCPICESSFVEVRAPSPARQVLRALLASFIPLPPSAFASPSRTCGVCGHRWKSGVED